MSNDNAKLAEMARKIAELEKQNAELKARKAQTGALTMKVSDKGAVSVYGLGRFPVTLYGEQWTRLLGQAKDVLAFIEVNKARLSTKADKKDPGPVVGARDQGPVTSSSAL